MANAVPWVLFFFVALASVLQFAHTTAAVRLANPDDVAFQAVVNHGADTTYIIDNARAQGRIYFATPFYRYLLLGPYHLGPTAFNLLRATLFFAEAGLLGWLIARVLHNPALGAAVTLILVAVLQIPSTFFVVLSYTPMAVGFVALLVSLHCHLNSLRRGSSWSALAAPALFLLSCFCLELFVLAAMAHIALAIHEGHSSLPRFLRDDAGILLAAAGFVTVYVIFAHEYRTVYDGTTLALHPYAAIQVVMRQVAGVLPGFELIIDRNPTHPWALPDSDILAKVSHLGTIDIALVAAQTLTTVWLFVDGTRRSVHRLGIVVFVALLGVAANVPIALTRKYQVMLFHREAPYSYAFYTFCCLVVAGVALVAWLAANLPRARRAVLTASAVVIFGASITAQASNRWTLAHLRERFPQNPPVATP